MSRAHECEPFVKQLQPDPVSGARLAACENKLGFFGEIGARVSGGTGFASFSAEVPFGECDDKGCRWKELSLSGSGQWGLSPVGFRAEFYGNISWGGSVFK
jgi:hypothetical protein